jgi:hypothetical protein
MYLSIWDFGDAMILSSSLGIPTEINDSNQPLGWCEGVMRLPLWRNKSEW